MPIFLSAFHSRMACGNIPTWPSKQKLFEVTEVDNFCVFDGAFHAKRLDHPVQLARNTGRTGVFGRNPASKQKKNFR